MVPSIKYRLGQCQRRSGSVDLQKMWKQRKPWNISSHNWQRFKNSNLHSHSILFLVFYCLSRAWEEKTTICINPILSKERINSKEKNTTSFLYTPRLGHTCCFETYHVKSRYVRSKNSIFLPFSCIFSPFWTIIWLNCYCWGNSSILEGRFSKWF